jgi:proteasome lid subunit RPN8/RPN11
MRMKKADYEVILAHARVCLPSECCGLLAGRVEETEKSTGGVRIVEKVYPLTNTDRSSEHFTVDPKEHFAAVKDMRASGISPLGNFHSHPATPARPSEEDIRLAHDQSASYLILSFAGDEPVIKSFRVKSGLVSEERLVFS